MERTEGGYLLSGTKHFASGSVAGNLLVTSAPYEDPEEGWQVLHFPVSLAAEGVTILRQLGSNGHARHRLQQYQIGKGLRGRCRYRGAPSTGATFT